MYFRKTGWIDHNLKLSADKYTIRRDSGDVGSERNTKNGIRSLENDRRDLGEGYKRCKKGMRSETTNKDSVRNW